MLARVLLFAGLIASAACQGTVKWSTLPYPSGNDKHLVQASSSITLTNVTGFPSGEQKIAFELLYRSGNKFGPRPASRSPLLRPASILLAFKFCVTNMRCTHVQSRGPGYADAHLGMCPMLTLMFRVMTSCLGQARPRPRLWSPRQAVPSTSGMMPTRERRRR